MNEKPLCVNYSTSAPRKKLTFLEKYLQKYTEKVREDGFENCYYVDAFAGTGKNYIEETDEVIDGSVLVALRTRPPFTHYRFIELDEIYIRGLRKNVTKFGKNLDADIETIHGDCNWCVPNEVLAKISATPAFFFLDPFAVEGLYWETVESIGDKENCTVLINFSIMGVTRFSQKKETRKQIDKYYGTPKWREIARNRRLGKLQVYQARKQFLNLYEKQLESKFGHVQTLFPVVHNGKYLYYLTLASNEERSIEISKDVEEVIKSEK